MAQHMKVEVPVSSVYCSYVGNCMQKECFCTVCDVFRLSLGFVVTVIPQYSGSTPYTGLVQLQSGVFFKHEIIFVNSNKKAQTYSLYLFSFFSTNVVTAIYGCPYFCAMCLMFSGLWLSLRE